jgi:hypothetical protein
MRSVRRTVIELCIRRRLRGLDTPTWDNGFFYL